MIDTFGGYDHRPVIAENCFYDTKNLCGAAYPALSPRAPRGKRKMPKSAGRVLAMLSGTKLDYIAENNDDGLPWLYVDNTPVLKLNDQTPKKMISMGAFIIVLPDKVYYNTVADEKGVHENGKIDQENASSGTLTFTICDGEKRRFGMVPVASATAPVTPTNGDLWFTTDEEAPILKQYDQTSEAWTAIPFTICDGGGRFFEGVPVASDTAPATPTDGDLWFDMSDAEEPVLKQYDQTSEAWTAYRLWTKITFTICDGEGKPFGSLPAASETEPETPTHGDLWLDTSDDKAPVLKQYNQPTGTWTAVLSTTVRVEATGSGIGNGFNGNDGLRIDGIPEECAPLNDYNGKDVILTAAEEDAIAFVGIMRAAAVTVTLTTENPVTVSRRMPKMDHVFECGNRLWGCRYGKDADYHFVNEIYCSALGDFKNWRKYQGVSTDAYAASVGAEGAWTGGIAYQNMPHFFKDNKLYRVYGSYPAVYRIDELTCRGVQAGAENSLQILNERLFYKSRGGVHVYDGAYPTDISEALGDVKYVGKAKKGQPAAAAGVGDNKYYISMLSELDGNYHFFVYDIRLGVWYREDNTQAVQFGEEDGRPLFLNADGEIETVTGGEEPVAWMAETGVIGMLTPDHKYVSRLTLRAALELFSELTVEIQYDSTEPWIHVATMTHINLRSFTLPIRIRRCDHFRLRLSGKGGMKLFSIAKTLEEGSDV